MSFWAVRAALGAVLLGTLFAAPALSQSAPESLVDTARSLAGTTWYGVYVRGSKVGHARTTVRLSDRTYRSETDIRTRLRSRGEDVRLDIFSALTTALRPPYALLERETRTDSAGKRDRTLVERVDQDYRATIVQAGEERQSPVAKTSFGLADVLAVARFVRSRPAEGATLRYVEWDDGSLGTRKMVGRVRAARAHVVDGARVPVYDIEVEDEDGSKTIATYDASGRMIRSDVSSFISLRREPEAIAKQRVEPRDIFTSHTVPVNHDLGAPNAVKTLVLTVAAAPGRTLGPATGQTVASTGEGRYRITLDPAAGPRVKALPKETEDALRATVDYPADHDAAVALARRAVGDARDAHERVRRLVAFVGDYVVDQTQAAPISVLEVIRRRRGDCTEHADLFTTLARAARIPCRSVAGLMFVGDGVPAFAGHAWNEVVLDGVWLPVDPSWNQMLVDATHIRYPIVASEEMAARSLLPRAVLRVESVNGQPVTRTPRGPAEQR